jgi:Tol biopolymer transport system component
MDLCDAAVVYGAVWYEDNTIVYSDVFGGGIYRVSSNGGDPELLVSGVTAMPQLLPDGKSVVFMDVASQPYKTVVQSLESEKRTVVLESGAGFYLPTGHIVYLAGENGFAVPFDLEKLETVGEAVPLNFSYSTSASGFALSDSGTLVVVPGIDDTRTDATSLKLTFVWVDREGNEEPLGAEPKQYGSFEISPNGIKVAMTIFADGNQDIYIWDIASKTQRRLTIDKAADSEPLWTPDSQKIVFVSGRSENIYCDIYWKNENGTGVVEKLLSLPDRVVIPSSWSSDRKTLILWEIMTSPFQSDIGMMAIEGNRERKGLLQEKYYEAHPQISPDGRFIAYTSNEPGKEEIIVRSFPDVDSGDRWIVSNSGGHSPLWSPNGNEIYYRNGDATMVVPIETEPTFNPGNPDILFEGTYHFGYYATQIVTLWDIHPTNGKFLMLKPPSPTDDETTGGDIAEEDPRKIIVVTNWFKELKGKVPVD